MDESIAVPDSTLRLPTGDLSSKGTDQSGLVVQIVFHLLWRLRQEEYKLGLPGLQSEFRASLYNLIRTGRRVASDCTSVALCLPALCEAQVQHLGGGH